MNTTHISALMSGAGPATAMPGSARSAAMDAVTGFAQALSEAEAQSQAALTTGADPHALVSAIAESKLAIDTVVTVRDRVVEAYQEILRMPV
ncbi:flagellar hook-basal body complex protein FliE [Jannaschia sp. 2305UL9-9]|uniref:flagellar hook-basal body complex protein FliE n=1 Tax=Jannaschia sp. 2305UL9-9 TaxID=3121638 RepID=UPI0035291F46